MDPSNIRPRGWDSRYTSPAKVRIIYGCPRLLAPSNRAGRIRFALPKSASVALDLLDLSGRVAAARASENFEVGRHEIVWHLPALPAGVYFLRLSTDAGSVGYARWVVMR